MWAVMWKTLIVSLINLINEVIEIFIEVIEIFIRCFLYFLPKYTDNQLLIRDTVLHLVRK